MPSRNRIRIHRRRAFEQQRGRCYYCGVRMWLTSPDEVSEALRRRAACEKVRCTAEHLVAQCEGGGHTAQNIVAACARDVIVHGTGCSSPLTQWRIASLSLAKLSIVLGISDGSMTVG
jgi:hypothetical protein